MPQCQFLFSAVFVFQKSYTGNILGIGQNKSQSSYLSDMKTESKGETEPSQEATTPLAVPGPGVAPQVSSDIALMPINSLHQEKPKGPNIYP
jgi:hypothetical protein